MPRTLFEHLSPDTGAKRILSLDGGGAKVMLSLGMLKAVEDELRRRAGGNSAFRLSDYYDLIGGGASASLVAAGLAIGLGVDELIEFYRRHGPAIFGRRADDGVFARPRFNAQRLRRAAQSMLSTRTLGSEDIRTGLAFQLTRLDTGGSWLITNHPLGRHYEQTDAHRFAEKRYRLSDLVVASAGSGVVASDVALDVDLDEKRRSAGKGSFVEAASANPSLPLFSMALDPAHKFGWKATAQSLMLTSVGVGSRKPAISGAAFRALPAVARAAHVMRTMTHEQQTQSVWVLQGLSAPKKPWRVSGEADETPAPVSFVAQPLLDYQRLDVLLETKPKPRRAGDPQPPITGMERVLGRELDADTLYALDLVNNGASANLELLLEIGVAVGRTFVSAVYPDPDFDLPDWRA